MNTYALKDLFAALGIPSPDLLRRDHGERAFPIIEQALLNTPDGGILSLDFDGVSVMDTSFADEAVVEIAAGLADGKYGDRFLVLQGPSPATIDNLEGTLARRRSKLGLLIKEGGQIRIVGRVEPNLIDAWSLALRKGELTARSLADRLDLQINTASMRLHKLYKARLLERREEVSSAGRQHVYEVPS